MSVRYVELCIFVLLDQFNSQEVGLIYIEGQLVEDAGKILNKVLYWRTTAQVISPLVILSYAVTVKPRYNEPLLQRNTSPSSVKRAIFFCPVIILVKYMEKNLNITKPRFRKHLTLRFFEFNSISVFFIL